MSLSTFNKTVDRVLGLDAALRTVSYGLLIYAQQLASSGRGEEPLTKLLLEIFEKLSDARVINRLFSLPSMYEWFSGIDSSKSTSAKLEKVMAGSMLFFYPLEHVWWFTTLKNKAGSPALMSIDGTQSSLWSVRSWFVYVVCDVIKTRLELQRLSKIPESEKTNNDRVKEEHLRLWLQACACDFIIAVQYSVANGPFPASVLSFAGLYGGIINLYIKLFVLPKYV